MLQLHITSLVVCLFEIRGDLAPVRVSCVHFGLIGNGSGVARWSDCCGLEEVVLSTVVVNARIPSCRRIGKSRIFEERWRIRV